LALVVCLVAEVRIWDPESFPDSLELGMTTLV
jgi:hypothetical protein